MKKNNSQNLNKSKPQKITCLELFRAIAALMVLFYHFFPQYLSKYSFIKLAEFAHSGVDFFFVISGFIIMTVHRKDIHQKSSYVPYLYKRFARVFPFFWVVLTLQLMLIPFIESAELPSSFSILLKNIFLFLNSELVIGVAWTLQHEISFYFLFSILILNKTIGKWIFILWFSVVAIVNYIVPIEINIPVIFSSFNIQFAMGMISAMILNRWKVKQPKIILLVGLIGFLAAAIFETYGMFGFSVKVLRAFYGLSSATLIVGGVAYESQYGLKLAWIWRILGRSSYSLYLTHLFFAGIIHKLMEITNMLSSIPQWLSGTLIILSSIICSCLFSSIVELPLTKYVREKLLKTQIKLSK